MARHRSRAGCEGNWICIRDWRLRRSYLLVPTVLDGQRSIPDKYVHLRLKASPEGLLPLLQHHVGTKQAA